MVSFEALRASEAWARGLEVRLREGPIDLRLHELHLAFFDDRFDVASPTEQRILERWPAKRE
jgi:hypothetical protein